MSLIATNYDPNFVNIIVGNIPMKGIVDSIKDQLNSIEFELQQYGRNFSGDFCNESFYGKTNIIMVNGFVLF